MSDGSDRKGLQRAELARRTGCNLETVRYYEKIGLLPAPPRTTAGYRRDDAYHERRPRLVLRARGPGVDESDQPCAEARDLAAAHLAEVRAKIADLKRMERVLRGVVVRCADGTRPECPLIETLFGAKAA